MIVLYEWRDLIENADYLIALQALAILQVSRRPNMHEKNIHLECLCYSLENILPSPVSFIAIFDKTPKFILS